MSRFTHEDLELMDEGVERWTLASKRPAHLNSSVCTLCVERDCGEAYVSDIPACPIAVVMEQDDCRGTPYYRIHEDVKVNGTVTELDRVAEMASVLRIVRDIVKRDVLPHVGGVV